MKKGLDGFGAPEKQSFRCYLIKAMLMMLQMSAWSFFPFFYEKTGKCGVHGKAWLTRAFFLNFL